jgi:ubiquinone/menaquinone biosynthesis C-methylase UbiE
MLNEAREKLPSGIKLQESKAEELPYPDNFFDYVVSTGAFHHFFDQERVVKEMRRVVKPGGQVIISDAKAPFGWLDRLIEKYEPGRRIAISR